LKRNQRLDDAFSIILDVVYRTKYHKYWTERKKLFKTDVFIVALKQRITPEHTHIVRKDQNIRPWGADV
jgi:hypothetical protein